MPGAVCDKLNQRITALAARLRRIGEPRRQPDITFEALIHHAAQQVHDIEIRPLVMAADVVDLTGRAGFQNAGDAPSVILNVQLVADITAIAIHRNHAPIEDARQAKRNQFLGKMVGPIVVRTVTGRNLQAIGVLVSAHKMVTARFAG